VANQGRTIVVNQGHAAACDSNPGTAEKPLATINKAAELAQPGDTVLVKAGIYRERVNPRRGGVEGSPIIYQAAEGEKVYIRGSDVFQPQWQPLEGRPNVFVGSLGAVKFGCPAYADQCADSYCTFNPYVLNFNKGRVARPHSVIIANLEKSLQEASKQLKEVDAGADINFGKVQKRKADLEKELALRTRTERRKYLTTLGQVFVDGEPMTEVETVEDLAEVSATWMVSPQADAIYLHFPAGKKPGGCLVELATRHTCFAPLQRRLGYITVRGFIIEHGANHFPTWGKTGWSQVGLLSTRTGHHWLIENNVVRYAKGVGIDCGSEGGSETMENRGQDDYDRQHNQKDHDNAGTGYHVIRNNHVCDNGHCGITGIRHTGTKILGNVIERNNRTGYTSPWWEFGGIKFHFFFDGLIEGNLIRDNEAHGIWIDNQWRGSRITRNVIINNLWSGINVELGRGPVLIDNNIIAQTRQGDGIYGHDVADVTIAHNLIYGNSNLGIWFAYCTPRVKPQDGCWDIKAYNNIIAGNKAAAIAYPMDWGCAGNNKSDCNLFMGGGENLDEGTGPKRPLFELTNYAHMGKMGDFLPKEITAQTADVVRASLQAALQKAGLPQDKWPNLATWAEQFFVRMEVWQAATGNDRNSKVFKTIRDGLQSRLVGWHINLDDTFRQVACKPIGGVDKDFLGQPMPPQNPLPGPFQRLDVGENDILLWPVRGIETTLGRD
jgi:hypothetical protein